VFSILKHSCKLVAQNLEEFTFMLCNIKYFVKISKLALLKQLKFFAMRTQNILFKSKILNFGLLTYKELISI